MTIADDIKKMRDASINTLLAKFDEVIESLSVKPPGRKLYVNGESKEIRDLCINLKTEIINKKI